jgi:5-hydroxyisourate hydrolase-like protein (transthyretin family)
VVVDRDGRPVPGVAVVLRDREEDPWGRPQDRSLEFHRVLAKPTTRTHEDGRFVVEYGGKDPASLVFLKDGYAVREWRAAAEGGRDLRIVLEPGSRFAVKVEDTDARPIQGARIILWTKPDAEGRVLGGGHTTDARGRCVVAWVPAAGLHMVHVSALGHGSRTLPADDVREEQTVVLAREAPVVHVLDAPTGEPVAGAAGILYREPARVFAAVLSERWELGSHYEVVPGTLLCMPGWQKPKEGEVSYRASVFAPDHVPGEVEFRASARGEPPRVEIRLARGEAPVALAGVVEPPLVSSVEVRTHMPENWSPRSDRVLLGRLPVDEGGRFVAHGLPDGPYLVIAEAPGHAPARAEVTAPAAGVRLRLVPEAIVEVRVVDGTGSPVAAQKVTVGRTSPFESHVKKTDAAGLVRFDRLPAGAFQAIAFAAPGVAWDKMPAGAATVEARAGETTRLDLVVPGRVRAAFRVRDERGAAVAGLDLRLRMSVTWGIYVDDEWQRVDRWTGRTDAAGTAEVEVYAGTYEIRVAQGNTTRSQEARIGPDGAVVDLSWPTSGATIFGRVTDAVTGAPVAGRPVSASLEGGRNQVGRTVTDADGRYEMTGLPEGPLSVGFALGANADRTMDAESPYPSITWTGSIPVGQRRQQDVVAPRVKGDGAEQPSVEASLRVTDQDTAAPLDGATGVFRALRDGVWISTGYAKTDGDGRASLRVLAGTEYRVFLYRNHPELGFTHHRAEPLVVAPSGGRVVVEAALAKGKPPER